MEKILDKLCTISTLVFLLMTTVMILVQAFAVITVNGELAVKISELIAKPASMISALAMIFALILAYMRGEMKG